MRIRFLVVALAAVATVAFITTFVWLLWVLVVALVLFWKGAGTMESQAPAV